MQSTTKKREQNRWIKQQQTTHTFHNCVFVATHRAVGSLVANEAQAEIGNHSEHKDIQDQNARAEANGVLVITLRRFHLLAGGDRAGLCVQPCARIFTTPSIPGFPGLKIRSRRGTWKRHTALHHAFDLHKHHEKAVFDL